MSRRLDEILLSYKRYVLRAEPLSPFTTPASRGKKLSKAEAKAAITSLIKELVAEAKPDYCDGSEKCKCSTEMEQYINSGKETAIIQFERNLLKALEEV